jgi:Baculovirus protein of unknown function (DUF816)
MEPIDVDDFAKKLIAEKCSALIESEKMLPQHILRILIEARDQYFSNPTPKTYDTIKRLFAQTKHVEDSIDYKDFNRRLLLIAFKFGLNKCKHVFNTYRSIIELALKRLDAIDPDLKSSPRAMLQHYNECLENLDNPRVDEHHLIAFAKEIATKIFIETIDVYNFGNKSAITMSTKSISSEDSYAPPANLLTNALRARKRSHTDNSTIKIISNRPVSTPILISRPTVATRPPKPSPARPKFLVPTPVFTL